MPQSAKGFTAAIGAVLVLLLITAAWFAWYMEDTHYTVKLISNPPGASVSVNGSALVNRSPVAAELRMGDVIEWEIPGFHSKTITMREDTQGLEVSASNEWTLKAELKKRTLRLIVISKPIGTSLRINGKPAAKDSAVYHEVAFGDVLEVNKPGYTAAQVTIAENMPELTRLESGNYALNITLEGRFSIESSEMAQRYLHEQWRDMERIPISRGNNIYDGDAFVIPIGTQISFDLHPRSSGSLAALHLGSDNFLTLIYPNQSNESFEVTDTQRLRLGKELSVVASEPLGRDWMIFLITEKPLNIPEIDGAGPVAAWARYYELGAIDSPGEQLLLDIVSQSSNTAIAMAIVAIDVVEAEN